MTEETNNVHKAIGDIEKCLDGKQTVEINALRNAFKIFELEKKINEQDLENKNLKLENENKSLKLKCDTVEVTCKHVKNNSIHQYTMHQNLKKTFS